jgi:hypothetical protein
MWELYRIGLAAGLGAGAGVVLAGLLASSRVGLVAALVLAAVAGIGIGLWIQNWDEAIAAALGGVAGAAGAAQVVQGTLKRGGTRVGTAFLVAVCGVLIAALALIPVVGYLEAVGVPALGARMRRGGDGRYAGLRILARD